MTNKLPFEPVNPKQDFVEMEKKLLDFWSQSGIVKKYLEKNLKSKKRFSFLDGPITANNPMGVHHAWGRTYKDLWQRFFNLKGYAQRFQNGFDEQGLWVEVEVEKELGFKNKKDIEKYGVDKFVNKCKERVNKFAKIQTEQSKRLGYFMDWENSYHTSSDENNYAIWNFLKICNQKGYLYKGRDSVPWCPRCGTAISQHEILTEEYKEITHKAVYVKYEVNSKSLMVNGQSLNVKGQLFLLVWTTTPWTLPSNVAIAVNPDLKYGIWSKDGENLIIETSRAKTMGIKTKPKSMLNGKELKGLSYRGIFDELTALKGVDYRVILDKDLVTAEEGTGLVHIAPGAGEEDFKLSKKENLAVIESIDEGANYIDGFGDLEGKNAKKNPDLIIKKLKDKDALFTVENYKHRYPTCWRCKTELVWRVVDEWYIAMDRKQKARFASEARRAKNKKQEIDKTLRQQMVEITKKINWIPKFGKERELDWLKNMHDWLISKKRYWGLALPIWECTKCRHFEVIGSKAELQERAIRGWKEFSNKSPHRPWVDKLKLKCPKCQSITSRIPDVGNPWLDAGIVPFSTLPPAWFPADFITESFPGQFKNWFYSLIAMSTVLKNSNPYKTVLGFASLTDEKGEEMHKSRGNAIEFNEAANKIGVDVMRWMYVRQNPTNNLLFGYHHADEIRRRFYLILWNSYKFFIDYANLSSWTTKNTNTKNRSVLDLWIIAKLNKLIKDVNENLEIYDAATAARDIEEFIVNDLSTWYIRRSRNRAGPTAVKKDENVFLSTLYEILLSLSKLLAPFTPFISEHMYKNLTQEESVNISQYPESKPNLIDNKLIEQMKLAREIAEEIHALRKKSQLKVRQVLASASYNHEKLNSDVETIIASEVNIKKLTFKKQAKTTIDTKLTPILKAEGEAREIIRNIQQARKEAGCNLSEHVNVMLPDWPKRFEDEIKKETLSRNLKKATSLQIVRSK